jgi:hypothetical protein
MSQEGHSAGLLIAVKRLGCRWVATRCLVRLRDNRGDSPVVAIRCRLYVSVRLMSPANHHAAGPARLDTHRRTPLQR